MEKFVRSDIATWKKPMRDGDRGETNDYAASAANDDRADRAEVAGRAVATAGVAIGLGRASREAASIIAKVPPRARESVSRNEPTGAQVSTSKVDVKTRDACKFWGPEEDHVSGSAADIAAGTRLYRLRSVPVGSRVSDPSTGQGASAEGGLIHPPGSRRDSRAHLPGNEPAARADGD
jgi:hypothetical protein